MNARKVLKVRGSFDLIDYLDGVYWLKQGTQIFKVHNSLKLSWFQKAVQRILCYFGRHKFVYSGYDSNVCFLPEHTQRIFGGWCESCNTVVQFNMRDMCVPFDPKKLAKKAKHLLWHRAFYGGDPTVTQQ